MKAKKAAALRGLVRPRRPVVVVAVLVALPPAVVAREALVARPACRPMTIRKTTRPASAA